MNDGDLKTVEKKPMSTIAKINWMFITAMSVIYLLFAMVGGLAPVDWSTVSKVFFVILEVVAVIAGLVVNIMYTLDED